MVRESGKWKSAEFFRGSEKVRESNEQKSAECLRKIVRIMASAGEVCEGFSEVNLYSAASSFVAMSFCVAISSCVSTSSCISSRGGQRKRSTSALTSRSHAYPFPQFLFFFLFFFCRHSHIWGGKVGKRRKTLPATIISLQFRKIHDSFQDFQTIIWVSGRWLFFFSILFSKNAIFGDFLGGEV